MNKNWLYRILALALVALLALPTFALAEDVFSGLADSAVEETEVKIGGPEKEEKIAIFADFLYASLGADYDLTDDAFDIDTSRGFSILVDGDDPNYSLTFKSSNKKVATVTGNGDVFFKAPGTCTITVKGRVTSRKAKVYSKIKFKVADKTSPETLGVFFQDGNAKNSGSYIDGVSDLYNDDSDTLKVRPGFGLVQNGRTYSATTDTGFTGIYYVEPEAFNADGDLITASYARGYSWKWSNTDVAYWKPTLLSVTGTSKIFDFKKGKSADWWMPGDPTLYPVYYKPGKTKLTFKTMAYSGNASKKVTVKIEVLKNIFSGLHRNDNEILKIAKDDEVIIYALDSVEVQTLDKVVVKIKVYNGTKYSVSELKDVHLKLVGGYSSTGTADIVTYGKADANHPASAGWNADVSNKPSGSIKAGKVTTITITCTNDRDDYLQLKQNNAKKKIYNEIDDAIWDFGNLNFNAMITHFCFKGFSEYMLHNLEIYVPWP